MTEVKNILQIVELNEFENACEKFKDVLFGDPYRLEYTDLLLIIKITANYIAWSSLVDHPVLKLQSLVWVLEPVYAEIADYNLEMCALCINLVSSDESSLQYSALDLLESGCDFTHIKCDIAIVCINILKNKDIQSHIRDKMMEVESNCNL